jgi:hypothetical protein
MLRSSKTWARCEPTGRHERWSVKFLAFRELGVVEVLFSLNHFIRRADSLQVEMRGLCWPT